MNAPAGDPTAFSKAMNKAVDAALDAAKRGEDGRQDMLTVLYVVFEAGVATGRVAERKAADDAG